MNYISQAGDIYTIKRTQVKNILAHPPSAPDFLLSFPAWLLPASHPEEIAFLV